MKKMKKRLHPDMMYVFKDLKPGKKVKFHGPTEYRIADDGSFRRIPKEQKEK